MEKLLSAFPALEVQFIEAVDGRALSEEERQTAFDQTACIRRNGRKINPGEIGCTLSHRKCYQKLIDSKLPYVLILEDDISIIGDLNTAINDEVLNFMDNNQPRILFFSGDYWYWRKRRITHVCWAIGSYAYIINRAAAKKILEIEKPFNVADDWDLYKSRGIALHAIHPYVIDANISDLPSDIQQEHWGNIKRMMSWQNILRSYIMGSVKRCLYLAGHFESKIRSNEG